MNIEVMFYIILTNNIIDCKLGAVMVVIILWLLDLQLPVKSVPITATVVSSNLVPGKVYSVQHYMIKFVSDLRQVGGFLLVLQFPPPIKLTATI
jgi:hypothetical protein